MPKLLAPEDEVDMSMKNLYKFMPRFVANAYKDTQMLDGSDSPQRAASVNRDVEPAPPVRSICTRCQADEEPLRPTHRNAGGRAGHATTPPRSTDEQMELMTRASVCDMQRANSEPSLPGACTYEKQEVYNLCGVHFTRKYGN